MNRKIVKQTLAFGHALALAGMLAACASAPTADGPFLAAANTSWTYLRSDTGSFGKGTAYHTNRVLGEQMWQGRKVRATELPTGVRLSDFDKGDWLAMVKGDTTLMTWEPSLGYNWPLTVGKSFNRNYRFVNHVTKQAVDIQSTMTVQAEEDVTVPAGTFKTLRILYTDSMGVESLSWYAPDAGAWVRIQSKRSAKFPAGPGTQDFELLSYTLKK